MGRGTKPRYVIDWEKGELLGRAHTGCVDETLEPRFYYPVMPPASLEIAFAKRLKPVIDDISMRNEGKKWDKNDFNKFQLATAVIFKVSNAEEFAEHPRVKALTSWWLTGSKIIDQDEYDSYFEWIHSFLEEG